MMAQSREKGTRARLVAGFCWKWSEVRPEGTLEPDVKIGAWERPWNAKVPKGKANPNPDKHPYTLWANTEIGEHQVGCIYSAQGFEFDSVGVIWGKDLVWRTDRWVAQPKESRDAPVRNSGDDMVNLMRNAYRVLLTRGINLEDAALKKVARNASRYPVEKSRGQAERPGRSRSSDRSDGD